MANNNSRWAQLSQKEKAELIRLYVTNGITDLNDIESDYNSFKDGGSIRIDPKNKGKFNATKKRTGKTTEELTHSKNPLTRKRAIFAQNARRWRHADGGVLKNILDGENDVQELNRPSFEDWYKTVPKEKSDTTNYDLKRAYGLAPQEQLDKFVNDSAAHLNSSYYDHETNTQPILKYINHPSLLWELADYLSMKKDDEFIQWGGLSNFGDRLAYVPRAPFTFKNPFREGGYLNILDGEAKSQSLSGILGKIKASLSTSDPEWVKSERKHSRKKENDSPTKVESEEFENKMNHSIYGVNTHVAPNEKYGIPYLYNKEIVVPGAGRVSSNTLDSLAKYARITGVPLVDAIGLASQETHMGGMPLFNFVGSKDRTDWKQYNRALGNSSYFRNYGFIPAEYLVRDFRYNLTEDPISRSVPPLKHALEYFKLGKYNPGDSGHSKDVRASGKKALTGEDVKKWLSESKFVVRDQTGVPYVYSVPPKKK